MFDLTRAIALNPDVLAAIEDLFEYHEWNDSKRAAGAKVREALKEAVRVIIANVPPCADRTVALRKISEARMDSCNAITHGATF